MHASWLWTSFEAVGLVLLSAVIIYVELVILTRVAGLRSFSKLSPFDFAVTIAIGSVVATVLLTENPPLVQGMVGLAGLYALQMGIAVARRRSSVVNNLVENEPLLIMEEGEVLEENLQKGRMTRGDLRAKLREANVIDMDEVRAVVMEPTGDVSVLHGPPDGRELDEALLESVRR